MTTTEELLRQCEAHHTTGWVAPKDRYAVPVLFNPYTGEPRDVRDVQSDPQGILIVPPGKVEMLSATCKQDLQVHPAPVNQQLLAALKTCVCAMQDYQAGIGITEMFDAGERMGRAAIAAAEGKV